MGIQDTMLTDELNTRFAVPGLRFETGRGGLTRAVVQTPLAEGELYLHGAHVTAWAPRGHAAVLWLSESSHFEKGKPIRGGVPICFPWFGPHSNDPSAPAHGFARLAGWNVASTHAMDGGAIVLELETTIESFAMRYRVEFGSELKLALATHLPTSVDRSATFEDALHTYFSVSDVRSISIHGLENASYLDKVDGAQLKSAATFPIAFSGETDRVYLHTLSDCSLIDVGSQRSIRVAKSGSRSTVVWNPWIDKSKRMADFGDEEWRSMVCIETANVDGNRIELAPGQTHETSAIISVSKLD